MTGVPAVTAPFLSAIVILGAAGMAKFWRPDYTARALQATGARFAGRRPGRSLVRALAAGEVAIAAGAIGVPGRLTGGLVAAAYGGFALFVLLALRQGWSLSTCGCFGRPDSRPSYLHAGLDMGGAAVGAWWAFAVPDDMWSRLGRQPWDGAPLILVAVVIAGLAYQIWSNPVSRQAQVRGDARLHGDARLGSGDARLGAEVAP